MRNYSYDDPEYRRKQSEITRRYWQAGLFNFKIKSPVDRVCKNPKCQKVFQVKPYDPKIYCSHSCSATVNNLNRPRKKYPQVTILCIACGKWIQRKSTKYCSLKCQQTHQYQTYINDWKLGKVDGNKGIKTQILSAHIKRYLNKKYNGRCSLCGWNQRNTITNKVPLEIDHIDGNSNNNKEENLRLICPNCHSLTPHFRNLNKGNGRSWRLKYLKQEIKHL